MYRVCHNAVRACRCGDDDTAQMTDITCCRGGGGVGGKGGRHIDIRVIEEDHRPLAAAHNSRHTETGLGKLMCCAKS